MRRVMALVRQDVLTRGSYRVQLLSSFVSLFGLLLPVYFVTEALDPVMEASIASQGGHFFTFTLVGMIVMRYCYSLVNSLPGAFSSAIRTGTLEVMFATPTPLPLLVAGMVGFPLLWTTVEATVLLGAGGVLGVQVIPGRALLGLAILALILLAYLSFAIVGVALVLAFRTTGPLLGAVLMATNLLGGVYYPTEVIPSWIQKVSAVLPMTYGLRALRQAVLEGLPVPELLPDIAILCGFLIVLLPL
ncbi:MAG TPA: ABC transporter permease, partial [Gemmatimonadales bacterium]